MVRPRATEGALGAQADKAEAEAARKAKEYEDAGEERDAADWKAIRAAIRAIRGANQG